MRTFRFSGETKARSEWARTSCASPSTSSNADAVGLLGLGSGACGDLSRLLALSTRGRTSGPLVGVVLAFAMLAMTITLPRLSFLPLLDLLLLPINVCPELVKCASVETSTLTKLLEKAYFRQRSVVESGQDPV